MASFSSRPSAKVTSTKTVTYISNICSVIQIATQLLSQCICQAGSQYLRWIAAHHQSCQKYHLRNISREIPNLLPDMATDCHIEKIENRVVEEQAFAK